jgi:dolichyl-diphosphooligosaccharide--protein glycosyltransferase
MIEKLRRWLAPAGLFLIALAVRALAVPSVLRLGEVRPISSDAYYHLRRVLYGATNFPAVLDFDPYVSFPQGGRPIWTPAFDWLLAGITRLCLGHADAGAMEHLVAWVPPVLGALTVVCVYALARPRLGARVAALAAALLALLPAHFWYSQLGFIDHHVAIALAFALLLWAALDVIARAKELGSGHPRSWGSGLLLGLALAGSLLVWPGCLLHVAALEAALVGFWLGRREGGGAFAAVLAAANALAWVLVWAFGPADGWEVWGDFSPVVLSGFQPWLFGCATLGFLALAGLSSRVRGILPRVAAVLVVGTIGAGLTLGLEPAARDGLSDAWRWFAKEETFQAGVQESAGILSGPDGLSLERAGRMLSGLFFATPLLLVVELRRLRRGEADFATGVLVWCAALLLAATLVQQRFMNSFSIVFVLLLANVGLRWQAAVGMRLGASTRGRWLAGLAFALGASVALWPCARFYEHDASNLWRALRGDPPQLRPVERANDALIAVARWLRENTPATSGYLDASQVPEYGVLAAWDDGHILRYEARRPTVVDNFGDDVSPENYASGRAYFASRDEAEAVKILDRLKVRYVVARRSGAKGDKPRRPRAMSVRLAAARGVGEHLEEVGDSGIWTRVPALARHQLIFEAEGDDRADPHYAIYERVPGARLFGFARPGAEVEARLPLRTPGRRLDFVSRVQADETGRYELRVPYATEDSGPAIRSARHYRLSSGNRSVGVSVTRTAVQRGDLVEVPRLPGGPR